MGQCLDMLIANSFKLKKFENFTMENYAAVAEYTTAYNSFVLPVCLAMRMVRTENIIFNSIYVTKLINFAGKYG